MSTQQMICYHGCQKKMDLDNPLCLSESKILANILQNHPLRFSIVASSLVPWIYLGQLWHTLKEDGSKYRLSFMLDRKEFTLTLDDLRTRQYSNCLKPHTTIINTLLLHQSTDKSEITRKQSKAGKHGHENQK
ncbi:hypothetical protein Tco_0177127 [Tanacetum coccineum]